MLFDLPPTCGQLTLVDGATASDSEFVEKMLWLFPPISLQLSFVEGLTGRASTENKLALVLI